MPYDPNIHDRHSIRLKGYDYASAGAYAVTICTQNKLCLFGAVADDQMVLNDAGKMVDVWWRKIPSKFDRVMLDAFIIMPNHMHGVLWIMHEETPGKEIDLGDQPGQTHGFAPTSEVGADPCVRPGPLTPPRLDRIVQWFKTMTTNAYIRGVRNSGWRAFSGRLWQRNYYEHILRDEADYHRAVYYINTNPAYWEKDKNHPRFYE